MERPCGDAEEMQKRIADQLKSDRIERQQLEKEEEKQTTTKVDPMLLQQQHMDKLLKR